MTQLLMPTEPPAAESVPAVEAGSIRGQSLRFFLIGSAGTLLQLVLYAVAAEVIGAQIASVASWLISTVVTNAAHRALTFQVRGAERNRSDQVVAFLTCLVGLLVTSVVLAELPDADGMSGVIAILIVNTVVGAARFFGMRWWLRGSGRKLALQITQAAHVVSGNLVGTSAAGLHH